MIMNMKVLEAEQGEEEENLVWISYFLLPDVKKHALAGTCQGLHK